MKPTHAAALLALAVLASPAPAAAFDPFCDALSSDAYPPMQPHLPPQLVAQVQARHGKGLSLAGFYNDPSLALAHRDWRHGRRWRHGEAVVSARY